MRKNIFISVVFLLLFISGHSQERRGTYFGFQFKPMISGSLINEGNPAGIENNVSFELTKTFGFAAGMVVRHDFSKMFSLESGISFVQRNQNFHVYDPAHDYTFNQEFGTVGYELPILALIYIQLSEQVYMNTSFGFAFDFYPSDVAVFSDDDRITVEGRRAGWVLPALSANIGWEWRTEKNGAFYIGGTYHRSFGDTYEFYSEYDFNNDTSTLITPMYFTTNGNYLTLDFRYFFHEDPEKKKMRKGKSRRNR